MWISDYLFQYQSYTQGKKLVPDLPGPAFFTLSINIYSTVYIPSHLVAKAV